MSLVASSRAALFLDSPAYGGGSRRGLDASNAGGFGRDDGGGESSESSSLGVNEEDDEVQSGLAVVGPLESLDSLDAALPVKRGLSVFFNGKSKSFQCLSEAATASDLAKEENPFNKRRRILVASKSPWRRRASCASLYTAPSLPGLRSLEESQREVEAKAEAGEEEEEDDDGGDVNQDEQE